MFGWIKQKYVCNSLFIMIKLPVVHVHYADMGGG